LETVFDSIQHPVKTVTASITEVSSDQENIKWTLPPAITIQIRLGEVRLG